VYEPDPEVIRAAGAGDTNAFEELVRAYQSHVWRFLRHFLGDAALAEDITQETFVRVYRRLDTFRFRSKFSTWVFQVARNAAIDALRSRQRRDRLLSVLEPRVTDPIRGNELRIELEAALQSLSPKLREAFVMVEGLGLSYREAAGALRIPEGTVKSRVHHARQQLVTWMRAGEDMANEA
jgi:RNA polymerase sigma-70 factor (ECF subfamily)